MSRINEIAAATLRASPLDAFWSVALPLARPGYLTGAVMGFAHTLGEFGVVLMIGGNIPGRTRTIAVQIYDHVEALEYAQAHWLAGGMLWASPYIWKQSWKSGMDGSQQDFVLAQKRCSKSGIFRIS